jgi:hypothetical protein
VHYSAFAAAFGRAHDTAAQLAARLAAFSASKAKVRGRCASLRRTARVICTRHSNPPATLVAQLINSHLGAKHPHYPDSCMLPRSSDPKRSQHAADPRLCGWHRQVATHNAGVAAGGPGAPKHTLALTHLADYTPDELERYATPRLHGVL